MPDGASSAPPVGFVRASALFGVTGLAPVRDMHNPLRIQLLDDAVRIVELVRPTIEIVARHDRDLASQLRRALSSIALNVAEGFGTKAGNRRLRFDTARGSLYEAVAGIRIAAAWGHIGVENSSAALAALDRLGALLYGVARR